MHFRSHHNGVVCVEAEEKSAGGIMTGIICIRKKGSEETFDHVPRSNEAQ